MVPLGLRMGACAIIYRLLKLIFFLRFFKASTRPPLRVHLIWITWKVVKTNHSGLCTQCALCKKQIFNISKEQNFDVTGLYWGHVWRPETATGAEKMSAWKDRKVVPDLFNWQRQLYFGCLVESKSAECQKFYELGLLALDHAWPKLVRKFFKSVHTIPKSISSVA